MKKYFLMFATTVACFLNALANFNVTIEPYNDVAIKSLTLTNFTEHGKTSTITKPTQLTIIAVDKVEFSIALEPRVGYRDAHMTASLYQGTRPTSSSRVNSGERIAATSLMIVSDLTATLITNKVTLSVQGGTVGSSYVMMPYGSTYAGKLPTPTRTGYSFEGWYTEQAAGTKILATTVEKEETDHTLYAHWTANEYTVTFDANGGTVTPASRKATYDQAYGSLPTPVKRGYDFGSWTNRMGATVTESTIYQTDENTTLYAKWTAQKYTIRYHANFGTDVVTTESFDYGSTTTLKGSEGRNGYTFKGWANSASAGIAEYAGNQSVNTAALQYDDNRTADLYAVWKALSYKVTLKANGGIGADQVNDRQYDDGLALEANPEFVREGHTLKGWGKYPSSSTPDFENGTTGNLSDDDITLYALWEPISYTIGFDKADAKATGTMADVEMVYGAVTNLPPCAFEKDGYEFVSWTNRAGMVYLPGAVVSNLTAQAGARMVFYAQWKPESYFVTLDAGEGLFETNGLATWQKKVTVDEVYGEFPNMTNATPKRAFSAWRYRDGSSWVTVSSEDLVPPKSVGITNLVAYWVKDDPVARALDAEELDFVADQYWTVYTNSTVVGGTCMAATRPPTGSADLSVSVVGPGTLSFRWRVQSQESAWLFGDEDWGGILEKFRLFKNKAPGVDYEYILAAIPNAYWMGGEIVKKTLGWTNVVMEVEADAGVTNKLEWSFNVEEGDDPRVWGTAYLDNVKWTPKSDVETSFDLTWNDDMSNLSTDFTTNLLTKAQFEATGKSLEDLQVSSPTGWIAVLSQDEDGNVVAKLEMDAAALEPVDATGSNSPLTIAANGDGTFTVEAEIANGLRGFWYSLWTTDDLAADAWIVVPGTVKRQNSTESVQGVDLLTTVEPGNEMSRFFKVRVTDRNPQ